MTEWVGIGIREWFVEQNSTATTIYKRAAAERTEKSYLSLGH